MADPDEFHSTTLAFRHWLQQQGATVNPCVEFADFRERHAGRGLVTTRQLDESTELFRIPHAAILTPSTSSLPPSSLAGLADPWQQLILALAHEHLLGAASAWAPYLALLPAAFDTPMFWSAAELAALSGSAVAGKIGRRKADAVFAAELLPRLRALLSAEPHKPSDAQLLQLCHRMGSAMMAYAFDLQDGGEAVERSANDGGGGDEWEEDDAEHEASLLAKGMVPLADMLNADADRNNARLFHEDGTVVMRTTRRVGAGAELLNDYGPLPRADVLRRYGYVTDNYAQYDVVEIPLALVTERAAGHAGLGGEEVEARTAYLDGHGILDDAYDIARPDSEDGQFPDELCALLNVLTMSGDEFEKTKSKDKLPKPRLSDAAQQLLSAILVHRYAMYPDTGAQPSGDDADPRRLQMARAVVDGEKEVLQQAATTLSQTSSNTRKRHAETLEEEARAMRNPNKK